jgi:hypothetical protein
MYENIISRFGCPKILVTDRGIDFLNSLNKRRVEAELVG